MFPRSSKCSRPLTAVTTAFRNSVQGRSLKAPKIFSKGKPEADKRKICLQKILSLFKPYRQLYSSLNYFVLKTFPVWVCTTHPDVLSSVKQSKPLFRGPVLFKKSEPFLQGDKINTQAELRTAGKPVFKEILNLLHHSDRCIGEVVVIEDGGILSSSISQLALVNFFTSGLLFQWFLKMVW